MVASYVLAISIHKKVNSSWDANYYLLILNFVRINNTPYRYNKIVIFWFFFFVIQMIIIKKKQENDDLLGDKNIEWPCFMWASFFFSIFVVAARSYNLCTRYEVGLTVLARRL